jgi:uncharacterized protein (TIGR00269 family)
MPHHKLALCKEHYLQWLPEQTEETIKKYSMFTRRQKVLISVSGGKDSLSLWDILWRLGYHVDGLYINLGIDKGINYSLRSKEFAEKFAIERNLKLHIVDITREYGYSIPEMAKHTCRGRKKVCSVCGLVKRHVMNRFSREHGYDVLATGHNLDDEVATLFGNTLSWSVGYLVRQGPVLPEASGLSKKVKPLFRFYERQMTAYAFLQGIQYIIDDCPYSTDATSIYYKQLLNQMEEDRPGTKLSFYLHFLKAKKQGLLSITNEDEIKKLSTCPSCGQPTSSPTACAFCLMIERLKGTDPH